MKMLHIFTEEPSAKIVFDNLLPKLLPENIFFRIYAHQGKQDLEAGLRKTLPSISKIPGSVILVTRDQDSGNCKDVKENIFQIIGTNCSCPYYIRIICTELESWFLGDLPALEAAYPRFKIKNFSGRSELRNVDTIVEPNKYLLANIPEYSGRDFLPKLEVAENVSKNMDVESNTSISFKYTIKAIMQLIQ